MRRTVLYLAAAGIALVAGAILIQLQSPTTALSSKSNVVVTNFQQNHGFVLQSNSGSQVEDNSTFSLGEQSLKITTEGGASSVFTRKSLTPALNFTDKALKVWVKTDSVDNIRELRISATGDDFRTWIDYWISGAGAQPTFLQNNKWSEARGVVGAAAFHRQDE